MQVSLFQDGGCVAHRITGAFSGRVSMWFDAGNKPIDAEQFDRMNRSRPVKANGAVWRECARAARPFILAERECANRYL